ncbi:plasmid partitioning protein RepB [Polycladidibacter stylochi]|uniref:plasmid partitioning protein RepB n=1 Tax=Polycladidibacter stylochi TaxID=1807766 RepID=UPI00083235E7|nr:plasmid partitioning protein RepB [Pseudovibrio stylochi]
MNDKRKRNKSKLSEIMTGNNAGSVRVDRDNNERQPAAREKSAVGRLGAALHSLTEQRSDAVDPSLAIQNLDAKLLLPSMAMDRAFEGDDDQLAGLMESIRENGQQVPILARPHPQKPGFYQIAYGHRRVKACQGLDIAVRAVVEDMSDEQLVIAQGKENEERKNLTYIQQCFFAAQLSRSFTREVVAAAVGAGDKTRVSKLTSIIRRIPHDLLEAIGSAPGIGRVKWENLAKACELDGIAKQFLQALETELKTPEGQALDSVDRFNFLHDLAVKLKAAQDNLSPSPADRLDSGKQARVESREWHLSNGGTAVIRQTTPGSFKVTIKDKARAQALSDFIAKRMDEILQAYEAQEQQGKSKGEDA